MKEGAAEGRIGRDAGLAITEAMVDAAIARDAAMREERIQRAGIRARERELRLAREFTPPHSPRAAPGCWTPRPMNTPSVPLSARWNCALRAHAC